MASHSIFASDPTASPAYPAVYGPIAIDRAAAGRTVSGRVAVPGSKSLSQRYLNLALVLRRRLHIDGLLYSEDIRHYLAALETLGCGCHIAADHVVIDPETDVSSVVFGRGGDLFCGAGGTMMRFLTAALTTRPGTWRLDGIARLRERPIAPLVDALRQLGADITYAGERGCAPLVIVGGSLRPGHARLDASASSQFLSAMLMAALATAPDEPTSIDVPALTSEPYVDLTVDAMAQLGGEVVREGDVWHVRRTATEIERVAVEADFSAVAYPAAAAALTRGRVVLERVARESRQGDRGFVDLLATMGAELRWHDGENGRHQLEVRGGDLRAVDADLESMPDQVPTLAALAPFARGTTRITNIAHVRLKESDRLAAMTQELRRVGARVEEGPDFLIIDGVWADDEPPSEPVTVETHGDHRIAMAMAMVGLRRPGLSIDQPSVVEKSYPYFWRDLETLIDT